MSPITAREEFPTSPDPTTSLDTAMEVEQVARVITAALKEGQRLAREVHKPNATAAAIGAYASRISEVIANGLAHSTDEQGRLLDEQGNRMTDSEGNILDPRVRELAALIERAVMQGLGLMRWPQ